MESEFDRKVAGLLKREPRYQAEAYHFVAEAVNFTAEQQKRRGHVSAAQLLDGIRKFAAEKFGAVAEAVLTEWGVKSESDAGTIVYLLIEVGLLRASEEDRPEDFDTGNQLFPRRTGCRTVRRKSDELPFIDH
ncbi:MAG: hypothetical protein MR051_00205 [Lentisphaeria bacterium]|nr:hypothetical protein [Lentisphaeria bacterium]